MALNISYDGWERFSDLNRDLIIHLDVKLGKKIGVGTQSGTSIKWWDAWGAKGYELTKNPKTNRSVSATLEFANPEGRLSGGAVSTMEGVWISQEVPNEDNPSAVIDKNERIHVVYEREGDIYYKYTISEDTTLPPEDIIWSDEIQLTNSGNSSHPSIDIKKGGDQPVLVYQEANDSNYDVYFKDESIFQSITTGTKVATNRKEPCICYDHSDNCLIFMVNQSQEDVSDIVTISSETNFNVEDTLTFKYNEDNIAGLKRRPVVKRTADWRLVMVFDHYESGIWNVFLVKTDRDFQSLVADQQVIKLYSSSDILSLLTDIKVTSGESPGTTSIRIDEGTHIFTKMDYIFLVGTYIAPVIQLLEGTHSLELYDNENP